MGDSRGQDVGQGKRRRAVELGVGARRGLAVGAPADELGRVAEAAALEVVVAYLDDALGAQRDEAQVLLRVPAAAPLGWASELRGPVPGVLGDGDDERLELSEQRAPAGH